MDIYLSGFIDASTFCDEFYYSYSLKISDDVLNRLEKKYFSELDKVSSRFSEFEEDLKKYPGTYFNEDQLRDKIIETKEGLSNK